MSDQMGGEAEAGLPAAPGAEGAAMREGPGPAAPDGPTAPAGKKAKNGATATVLAYVAIFIGAFVFEALMAPRCTSSSVTNTVLSIVENKLLHVGKFSVSLVDIAVLDGDMVFGDRRCSAGLMVGGRRSPRTVEYRWTTGRHGAIGTVYAKLK